MRTAKHCIVLVNEASRLGVFFADLRFSEQGSDLGLGDMIGKRHVPETLHCGP